MTGWPVAARWTRIWWVRPVSSRQSRSAATGALIGELGGKPLVGPVVLGAHHQPGGALVEAVDDPRPRHPADPRKARPSMGDQRVDQRAVAIARGGMDDEAGGLVD